MLLLYKVLISWFFILARTVFVQVEKKSSQIKGKLDSIKKNLMKVFYCLLVTQALDSSIYSGKFANGNSILASLKESRQYQLTWTRQLNLLWNALKLNWSSELGVSPGVGSYFISLDHLIVKKVFSVESRILCFCKFWVVCPKCTCIRITMNELKIL